jgi:NAD(P)-dependent dehydrogenase (short-subunit alcohol dehydrogenase family)
MQITDRVFLITGGASGLGAATVRMVLAAGGKAIIADVNRALGEALAASSGGRARFVQCDVTAESDAQAAVAAAGDFGVIGGLINCAGIGPPARTLGRDGPHSLELFDRVVRINLIGSFNMLRLCAQVMATQAPNEEGERGVIINTASVAAFDGQIGQAAYAASKGGIVGMTLPIARDLARDGIRVVTIAPGLFLTPLLESLPPEAQASLGKQVPFPSRLGRPEEFALMVSQVLANPMLNGETIRLDGAIRMAPK